MINRLLIRIKVLQILYSYYYSATMTSDQALSTLEFAFEKSYRLYLYLCSLPIQVANAAESRLDIELKKLVPDEHNVEVLTHLKDNLLTQVILKDERYMDSLDLYTIKSDHLKEYIANSVNSELSSPALEGVDWSDFDSVRSYWKSFYKRAFVDSEEFCGLLEDTSVYLNDDIFIIFSFVTKLFNAVREDRGYLDLIKPQFSSDTERVFGKTLLALAISNKEAYRDKISTYFKGWDRERVSEMDYIILQLALTEALNFHEIATSVIINEYLNLARYYSSPNSTTFLNGIMHNLFTALKSEGHVIG